MKNNAKAKIIAVIVAVILAIIIIPSGIYCAVEKMTPIEMVSDIFTSNEKQIIGKWQNESGSSAYQFYDNGTYDCYFSTFSYSGEFGVKGDELTLTNPNKSDIVVYKIKVNEKKMTMKVYMQNGIEANKDEEETAEYNRVERIKTKTINELLDSLTTSAAEE